MPSAARTLAEIAAHTRWLVIRCDRCPRYGRLRTDRLLARYGSDVNLPTLLELVAADCPRQVTRAWYGRCGVRYEAMSVAGPDVGSIQSRRNHT